MELEFGVPPCWDSILILYQPIFIKHLLLQKMLSYQEDTTAIPGPEESHDPAKEMRMGEVREPGKAAETCQRSLELRGQRGAFWSDLTSAAL